MKKLPIIVSFYIILSCKSDKLDNNFSFLIITNMETIDSKKNEYTRNFAFKKSVKVDLQFTKNEIEIIQRLFLENKIDRFPQKYIPNSNCKIMPISITKVYFNYLGRTIEIHFNDCNSYSLTDRWKINEIKEIVNEIQKIVYKKEEIKKLPKGSTFEI